MLAWLDMVSVLENLVGPQKLSQNVLAHGMSSEQDITCFLQIFFMFVVWYEGTVFQMKLLHHLQNSRSELSKEKWYMGGEM
jgi:hypothetical protein